MSSRYLENHDTDSKAFVPVQPLVLWFFAFGVLSFVAFRSTFVIPGLPVLNKAEGTRNPGAVLLDSELSQE